MASSTQFIASRFSMSFLLLALCMFLLQDAATAQTSDGFFDNINVDVELGLFNAHTDFDRISGNRDNITGSPFPYNGNSFGLRFTKPLGVTASPDYNLRVMLGLEYLNYRSATVNFNADQVTPIVPGNINNYLFGPKGGINFEYLLTERFSIEPFLHGAFYMHNPTSDVLLSGPGKNIVPFDPLFGNPPYNLRDFPQTREPSDDAVAAFMGAVTGGIKFSHVFIGNFRYFVEYSYTYLLNDYFDNMRDADPVGQGRNENDSITRLNFGLSFPLSADRRQTEETIRKQVRVDRRKIAKIERIQNIANLVETDEDLRELQRIMSDKILLYDTPGVRFNELASKTFERRERLGNTDFEIEMVQVPGGSYIIGLTAVDELNIQVQGRKRITINPFMVDKYEVTNEQYRIFLIAMGALPRPLVIDPADSLNIRFDYGARIDLYDLIVKAGLEDYRNHVEPPTLDDVYDLLPDSLAWKQMGLNDVIPWNVYFLNPFYNDRPVVCINWYQAKLFATWAGKRLLTESEWEYVARSGVSGRVYPWDGLEVQTKTGKYRSNFKQERGVYDEDGYPIVAPVDSYLPNDFGLYNMSGNVSEWVVDSWNPSYVVLQNVGTSNFVSPSYTNINEVRKVHRGGSWQSTKFYIGVGVRNFHHKNQGTPYIGFRAAKSVRQHFR